MISRLGFLPFFGALSRLDNYLLLHHRMLWISKIHYVLYATTLLTLPLTLAALLVPISTASGVPDWSGVYLLTGALGAIGGVYWAYRQTLFHIGGQYGNLPRFMAPATLGLYLVCGAAFVGMTMLPWAVIHSRGAAVISESDLQSDLCKLNKYNVYFTCYDPDGYKSSVWHANESSESSSSEYDENESDHESDFERIVHSSRTYFRAFVTDYYICHPVRDETQHDREQDLMNDIYLYGFNEYIRTFGKYGGKIQTDAEKVAQAFKSKSDLFTGSDANFMRDQKAKINYVFDTISTSRIIALDMDFYLIKILVLVYCFAIIVWAFAVMGRMEAILTIASASILLPLGMNIVQYTFSREVFFYSYLLLMAIGLVIAALNRRNYSRLSLILAGYAAGGLPFLVYILAFTTQMNIFIGNSIIFILSSLGLHATLILPWMHGRFVRMKALPRI